MTQHTATWARRRALPLLVLILLAGPATATALADPPAQTGVIVLPGATSAEGIAAGRGSTFFAGDLFAGDIYRGDIRRGAATLFVDAPAGRQAVGIKVDLRHDLVVVAGGFTGHAYFYDSRTGATVADVALAEPNDPDILRSTSTIINDVVVTREGAWFTDSFQAKLFFVPISRAGVPGPVRTLDLQGPAADTASFININGIQATADGETLIVSHLGNGQILTVDPDDGTSAVVAGVDVPAVDGLVLRGRTLWAVQNGNQVSRIRLDRDLTSGTVERVITDPAFGNTATAALFGATLAVVNSHLDTGLPPTSPTYEIVLVRA